MTDMQTQFQAAAMKGALMVERDRLALSGNEAAASAIDDFLREAPLKSFAKLHEILTRK
jgi:hypothetical protein